MPIKNSLKWILSKWVVQSENGCWLWTGHTKHGYGYVTVNRKSYRAHRYIYEQLIGSISEARNLHHACGNRSCVNPEHLQPIDKSEHAAMSNNTKTHCPSGHEYTEENTGIYNGKRYCRSCRKIYWDKYKSRRA